MQDPHVHQHHGSAQELEPADWTAAPTAHAGPEHAELEHAGTGSWRMAASATLHCLTGCAIGEVLGLVIGTALGWSTASTIALAIVLAFFFGYALTLVGVRRAGIDWGTAIKLALAADTLSIAIMELVDNAVVLVVPGAMEAGLASLLFWASLAFALAVAFVVTWPVNKWMIERGRGHAVVHHVHH